MTRAKRTRLRSSLRLLVLLCALTAAIAYDADRQLDEPLRIGYTQTLELSLGEHLETALAELDERGLFADARQRLYLLAWARLRGVAPHIKAGEYALSAALTPRGLLALLISGKVILHEVRFIEGWRFAQAWQVVQQAPALHHTLAQLKPEELAAALGRGGSALEGRIFPDTYRFPKGTSDAAILHQALAQMDKVLGEEWRQRAPALPYDAPEQALIMASIVEKETGQAAERAQIAGVFVRRLRLGMRLQTDPAVIYGLGAGFDGDLRSRDLTSDTPYNTYTRDGLPPTPICLPGRESIHAALHPDEGHALYFVARGDGSHQFSETLAQHNAAVRRYQLGGR